MNGLLIKDFRLLLRQGRYFGMVLILACAMAFAGSKNFSSFITSYLTFMITMFSFSSFSYDEYDNGMTFLTALPSGRRDYVKAKYAFGILLIFGGWLTASLLRMLFFLIRFSLADYLEVLPEEPVYLMICLIYIGCAFPVLFKYGAEKGRNATFVLLAVIALAVYALYKLHHGLPVLTALVQTAERSPGFFLLILAAVCILVLFCSYQISLRIMTGKEF